MAEEKIQTNWYNSRIITFSALGSFVSLPAAKRYLSPLNNDLLSFLRPLVTVPQLFQPR